MNFALKYRPKSFGEIVGQNLLVRVLENSFAMGRVPQAIMLVGCSGVGKTTTARVIALSLSCKSGPTINPCGVCDSCVAVLNSSHPDVLEIDAASNTSIEDIKVILENVRYLPIEGKFKVYIIDEVHMLSNSAFNALLKTLEEPLLNVKFILATTEMRKVPSTVISRCQRFDLLRISTNDLIKRLNLILAKENISCKDDAIMLIAKKSGGSMRDAIFLLERVLSYNKGEEIDISSVNELLGCMDRDVICDVLGSIIISDTMNALVKFENLCQSNNPILILEDMLELIYETCHSSVLSINSPYINNLMAMVSEKKIMNTSFLLRLWQVLFKGIQEVRNSSCVYSSSEMLVVKLSILSDLPSPADIIKRFKVLNLQSSKCSIADENAKDFCLNLSSEEIFKKILNVLQSKGEKELYDSLFNCVSMMECGNGFLMLRKIKDLPRGFSDNLSKFLNINTQKKWFVTVQNVESENYEKGDIDVNSVAKCIIDEFKGAKILDV